ncbi:ATP-dependent RNA helicase DbpA [Legionella jamestowniensis DSM 19215]|uniref:ATP-dependent RNA helicase DbpA n=2 Tax=Legionella jamestowniensis TaxID=455 RepID=A0A0W0UGN2_9GAMM|nr:ATP-dependent RNA helicase DbpA [Legionella jamestowniensis]SFL70526.1 ATP-dependent RNA helicase DbpA [Legionella jamestowniensis DSM 19215]
MKSTEDPTFPASMDRLSFCSLPLREELLTNISSLNYKNTTPIQAQSLPIMLNGSDLIAQSKTGSGKTAAFGLALLNLLKVELFAVQALVLCPTRELAEQVSQALRRFARLLPNVKILNLSGGMPMKPQLDSLRHGAHIIVGTPGRVQKHLTKESLSLRHLRMLILDEADRMLDMGFFDAIKEVLSFCPQKRQTLLFSATYPAQIKQLSSEFLHDPKHIIIEELENNLDIEQCFYEVSNQANKFSLLKALLVHHQASSTLIFCNTKEQTTQLTNLLNKEGFSAIPLHGDLEQIERDQAMIRFVNQSCSILVATDVAARGLDIKELPMVINYELSFEHDVHIHRIGRTGRAGNSGIALSITTPSDAERICLIEQHLAEPLRWGNINTLTNSNITIKLPLMVTLCLSAGKKDKISPGDILGALTKDAGIVGDKIGKINISALYSYVAIERSQADKAFRYFQNGKLKGRRVGVKRLQ